VPLNLLWSLVTHSDIREAQPSPAGSQEEENGMERFLTEVRIALNVDTGSIGYQLRGVAGDQSCGRGLVREGLEPSSISAMCMTPWPAFT